MEPIQPARYVWKRFESGEGGTDRVPVIRLGAIDVIDLQIEDTVNLTLEVSPPVGAWVPSAAQGVSEGGREKRKEETVGNRREKGRGRGER